MEERISIALPIQLTTHCSVISPSYIQGEVGTLLNGYVRECQFARPQSGTLLQSTREELLLDLVP